MDYQEDISRSDAYAKGIREVYDEANREGDYKTAQRLADKFSPKFFMGQDPTLSLKTVDDAIAKLGEANPYVKEYRAVKAMGSATVDLQAFLSLRIVCAALNGGWHPVFEGKEREAGYTASLFQGEKGAWPEEHPSCASDSFLYMPHSLLFKNAHLARYAARQFECLLSRLLCPSTTGEAVVLPFVD